MYYGGKNGSGVYQAIINFLPPHKRYIEAFLGSGAILRYKRPAEENIGLELNSDVISQFQYGEHSNVLNTDAFAYLGKAGPLDKDTLIYADPPYPLKSRRAHYNVYKHELTDADHRRLLELLKSKKCLVAISSYKNPMYEKELKGWNKITFQTTTRVGPATECLYMNYPTPQLLHDYNYLGEDFIERQRIKRKITRHVQRLMKLPALERQAILESISGKFF